jgi:hypothetical protein
MDASVGGRSATSRVGYAAAIAVNVVLLYIVNVFVSPDSVPFLTAGWNSVLWLIDLSLVAGVVVNAIYLWYDAAWFKAISDTALAGLTVLVAAQVLRVFPFDFTEYDFNWATTVRVVLICVVVGSAIAVLVNLIQLTRLLLAGTGPALPSGGRSDRVVGTRGAP